MTKKSLCIILNQYKKEHISEEEAVQLIEDMFSNKVTYYPWYTPSYTYTTFPDNKSFEITCK